MSRRLLMGCALVVALLGSACGSSDDDSSSGAPATTAATAGTAAGAATSAPGTTAGEARTASDTGVTEDEIKVGLLVTQTGNASTASADFVPGFEAFIERLNEEGGIHGRTIDIVSVRDDGGDPARNATEMQSLFEQEDVFTVLGSFPQFGALQYVESNQLPIIGTNYDPPTWEKSEYGIAISGSWKDETPDDDPPTRSPYIPNIAYVMGKLGLSKLGVIAYNHPGSTAGSREPCEQAAGFGLECVYEDYSLNFGFTDLGASIEQIRQSGAELIWGALDAGGGLTVVRSLKRAGIDIPVMFAVVPTVEQAAASPDLIGNYFGVQGTPPFDSDDPAMVEMREELEFRKPGVKLSLAVANGWSAGHLLAAGLEAAGINPTRASFHQAIRSFDAYQTPFGSTVDFTTSPEERLRAGIKPDPNLCGGVLVRGDAATGRMVQVGEKPALCLNAVEDAASLAAKLEEDTSTLDV